MASLPRLAALGLVAAMIASAAPAPVHAGDAASSKLDEPLKAALRGEPEWARWADAEGRLEVLLAGAPHPAPPQPLPSREAWRAYWAAQAAPLFGAVRGALEPGDVLVRELPAAPVVKVKVAPERVLDLAALPQVRIAALDWPEAVHIAEEPLGPAPLMAQSVPMTGAFDVHELGFLGQGVKLAMIDTGIDDEHPMFRDEFGNSRVVAWYDAAGNCQTPCDVNGHGTHTASTAAGSSIYGGRYQGVAPRADIYGIRIFVGGGGSWEDAQEGLQAAFDLGADVTSNSWGGGCDGGGIVTEQLAEELAKAGLQHVFAAGNSGPGSAGNQCPGRNDLVISVAAVDKQKVIAGFSSGGPCPDDQGGNTRVCPDVSAVGVLVDAAWLNKGYRAISGTSMATPHVAGAAAVMYQLNRALQDKSFNVPAQETELFFEEHAEDLGEPGNDNRYGWGFIRMAPMADELLVGAQARLSLALSVARPEIRVRDTNTATLTITNVGAKPVSGTARIIAGGEGAADGRVYGTQAIDLDPGASTTVTADIPGADLVPTTYHVVGQVAYSYTSDAGRTVSATVEDFATFLLRGVRFAASRTLPFEVKTGHTQTLRLDLVNVGNEPATQVGLIEGVPLLGFQVLPSLSAQNPPFGAFSNPAPGLVAPNPVDGTFDMAYAVPGVIQPGHGFQVAYRVGAAVPGDYAFRAIVSYTDAIGDEFTKVVREPHRVAPVAPPPA